MNNDIYVSPFKRLCITIGNLPTAYLESMSYYEGLTYLVNYLSNNVIPAVNNNGEAVEELQSKFVELQHYVDTYFDNLDVQTEIDNKLDEMASEGQLATIILDYLQMSGLMMYDTLADMKATDHVIDGSFLETVGGLVYNDGHRTLYRVREKDPADVIDEVELVELTNFPDLVAEKLYDDEIETMYNDVETLKTNVGDLSSLTTTANSDLVSAINEVDSDITTVSNEVGDLTNLTTSVKSDLVSAINEIDSYPIFNLSETYQAYRGTSDSDTAQITLGKFFIADSSFTATSSGLSNAYCNVLGAANSEGSIGKIYGIIHITANYTINGTNGYPCIRLRCTDFGINVPDEGYLIWSAGNCYCNDELNCGSIYIGSDGYIYLFGNLNTTASSSRYSLVYNPCLYFWTSFGDVPAEEE